MFDGTRAQVADLRRALDSGELFCVYEPVMHLATNTVVAMEALVRWRHPARGVLEPAEFLTVAERGGLELPLTRWVLDAALHQTARWCEAGTYVGVSVNVSPRCVCDDGFADAVEGAMAVHGVPPHLVEIELTERAFPDDVDAARRVLGRLHRLGVNITIDGFGTGCASLAYLREVPVDTLKLDASFTVGLGWRPGDGAIARAVLALGRSLGLQVVAEGVADEHAARCLTEVGYELAQGFRWTRPLSGDDALTWARAWAAGGAAAG